MTAGQEQWISMSGNHSRSRAGGRKFQHVKQRGEHCGGSPTAEEELGARECDEGALCDIRSGLLGEVEPSVRAILTGEPGPPLQRERLAMCSGPA